MNYRRNHVVLSLIVLLFAARLAAGQDTTLYSFPAGVLSTSDISDLVRDAKGNLYGTRTYEPNFLGGVFEVSPATGGGWTEKDLYAFGANGDHDGYRPSVGSALIIDSHGNLYGTTEYGGSFGVGTIYELSPKTDGTWTERVLFNFGGGNSNHGAQPEGGLVMDASGNLYGTAVDGGAGNSGAVYELSPQSNGSWKEQLLYSFSNGADGGGPKFGLTMDSSGNLYGTATTIGGSLTAPGLIFKLAPASGGTWTYSVLHNFSFSSKTDGYSPSGHLTLDASGNLYGTIGVSPEAGGAVYELTPATQGPWSEKLLYDFPAGGNALWGPEGGVTFDSFGNLYGSASQGGLIGETPGGVFELSPASGGGWTQSTIYEFGSLSDTDGANPLGNVIIDAQGNIFGATSGTVFEIENGATSIAPPVITPGGGTYRGSTQIEITDATPGTIIHYTTDGTVPTVTSPEYIAPFLMSSSEYVQAIAANASNEHGGLIVDFYNILPDTPPPPAPIIYPQSGSYTSPQTLVITDSGEEALIYYTTDGTTPTASSTPYSGPVTLSQTETVNAIAYGIGSVSPISTASYNVSVSTTALSYPVGALSGGNLALNGAKVVSNQLQLTDGGTQEARSAWFNTKVYVGGFVADFEFQQLNPFGDGLTFTIQNQGLNAVGYSGGGLGYQGIANSVAVKFDLYSNNGEGPDSTGVFVGGVSPTKPFFNLASSDIDLHSGDVMHAHLTYNGTMLTVTLTDTKTSATNTESYTVNIPQAVGASTAYVGFTGATGGATSTQNILSWSYTPQNAPALPLPAPLVTPAGGVYTEPPQVTMVDGMAGASIYYTVDGSVPTAGSYLYSAPFTVAPNSVVSAIAVLAGHANSAITTVAYSDTTTPALDFPAGGFTTTGLTLNGATVTGNYLQLTDGGTNEARSVWSSAKLPITTFVTDFKFQLLNSGADGFTFAIQNTGTSAVGAAGGGLGYQGIGKSFALKFDLYNNDGEGPNSIGVYSDGVPPTLPYTDLTPAGIDLHSGDIIDAQLTYDGSTLAVTLMDMTTNALGTFSFPVDIPAALGSTQGYVGFTGGTGGITAVQNILSWSFMPSDHDFISFDAPGAATKDLSCLDLCGTTPVSINQFGTVAGWYSDMQGFSHGFVRDRLGNFTSIDYNQGVTPTSGPFAGTQVIALNNKGTVLGSGPGGYFLRDRDGTFTALSYICNNDPLDMIGTAFTALNDSGTTVGSCNGEGVIRASDGTITTFSNFDDTITPTAINNAGVIAGTDVNQDNSDDATQFAFRRTPDGTYTTFTYGPSSSTVAQRINSSGLIAGITQIEPGGDSPNTTTFAIAYSLANKFPIVFRPPSLGTGGFPVISGINTAGEIVGSAGVGFIRNTAGAVLPLQGPGETSTRINGVNDWGVITGTYLSKTGVKHAFIWKCGSDGTACTSF